MRHFKYYVMAFVLLALVSSGLMTYSYQRSDYLQYIRYLPNYDLKHFPPKVLVYSSMTSEYLIEHARELHKDYGFDGFILTQLPSVSWPGRYAELQPYTAIVKKGNEIAYKNGIKNNFLKVGMEQGDIKLWQDEAGWAKDLQELTKVSAWARKTGFRGIALDTETYHELIWNNGIERNALPNIRELIQKRGLQTTKAIMKGFPDAEILVIMEGHLYSYTSSKPHKYAYWIHFFNGMLQARPAKGVDLLAERTYKVPEQWRLKNYYKDIKGEIIADNVDEPAFWLNKCSIVLGLWPLGREYNDKRANLSVEQFKEQFNSAIQYCPKYVWIYAHGLGWWQVADPQRYRFNLKEGPLPTVRNLEKYQDIVRKAKNPELKLFYKELKNNKKYTYLDLFLESLLKVK